VMLLVDIGNTRVKWATLADGRLSAQRAEQHSGWDLEQWRAWLRRVRGIRGLLVANVAGDGTAALLADAARSAGLGLDFAEPAAELAGMRNAYRVPGQLGVDRWVAMFGAHRLQHGHCCVLDVGTAATLDAVAQDGTHLGGYIVPGPQLMVSSLHTGTRELAVRSEAKFDAPESGLADNTRDAIERGCATCVAAFADRVVDDVGRQLGARPALWVTGGGAGEVLPLLRSPARWAPDLVLRGLAELLAVRDGQNR
jgi:type III pantothenate kinase